MARESHSGIALEYDKVQLSYPEPSWRGLVVFSWSVFPGGLGLILHPPVSSLFPENVR